MGAATEKARLPRFSLVLGIESCCEVDDQRRRGTHSSCRTQSEICDVQRVVGETVNWSFTERSSRRVEMITDDVLLRRRPNTTAPW